MIIYNVAGKDLFFYRKCNRKGASYFKLHNKEVPVSAYDLFEELKSQGFIQLQELNQWKKIIGLRNVIVHDIHESKYGDGDERDFRKEI